MIDLTDLELTGGTTPRLLDWGGELVPPFGGVTQRLDRLGSRHSVDCVAPARAMEPNGRLWIARLKRAKREGAIIAFPQVGFDPGNPGTPVVAAAVTAGNTVPLSGLTSGYRLHEGQWLTIFHAGRRYLYSINTEIVGTSSGTATIQVTPFLRTQLSQGDVINLSEPEMEGWLAGDEFAWSPDTDRTVSLKFTVTERA